MKINISFLFILGLILFTFSNCYNNLNGAYDQCEDKSHACVLINFNYDGSGSKAKLAEQFSNFRIINHSNDNETKEYNVENDFIVKIDKGHCLLTHLGLPESANNKLNLTFQFYNVDKTANSPFPGQLPINGASSTPVNGIGLFSGFKPEKRSLENIHLGDLAVLNYSLIFSVAGLLQDFKFQSYSADTQTYKISAQNTYEHRENLVWTDQLQYLFSGDDEDKHRILLVPEGYIRENLLCSDQEGCFWYDARIIKDMIINTAPFREYKHHLEVAAMPVLSVRNGINPWDSCFKPGGGVSDQCEDYDFTFFSVHKDEGTFRTTPDGRDNIEWVRENCDGNCGSREYNTVVVMINNVDQVSQFLNIGRSINIPIGGIRNRTGYILLGMRDFVDASGVAVVHELGHSFALGDEYLDEDGVEFNIGVNIDRRDYGNNSGSLNKIKDLISNWSLTGTGQHRIVNDDDEYPNDYVSWPVNKGPNDCCIMNSHTTLSFCPVCSRLIALRLSRAINSVCYGRNCDGYQNWDLDDHLYEKEPFQIALKEIVLKTLTGNFPQGVGFQDDFGPGLNGWVDPTLWYYNHESSSWGYETSTTGVDRCCYKTWFYSNAPTNCINDLNNRIDNFLPNLRIYDTSNNPIGEGRVMLVLENHELYKNEHFSSYYKTLLYYGLYIHGELNGNTFSTHPDLDGYFDKLVESYDLQQLLKSINTSARHLNSEDLLDCSLYGEFDLSETFADSGTSDFITFFGICRNGQWPNDPSILLYPKHTFDDTFKPEMHYYGLQDTIFNNCTTEWQIITQNSEIKIEKECGTWFMLRATDESTGYRYEITFNRMLKSILGGGAE